MLTLFAKSLAGDIVPLSVPSEPHMTWHAIHPTLAQLVCPEDPSRLVLVSLEEEDEKSYGTTWGLFRSWNDGDAIAFLIKDAVPFHIHFAASMHGLREGYDQKEASYNVIEIRVESDETQEALYEYPLMYSPQENVFIRPSSYSVEEDENDVWLSIKRGAIRWTSLYEMIKTDDSIPLCFRGRICRSIHRKWSHYLRGLARPPCTEPRRRIRSPAAHQKRVENALVAKGFYRLFRQTPPPYSIGAL